MIALFFWFCEVSFAAVPLGNLVSEIQATYRSVSNQQLDEYTSDLQNGVISSQVLSERIDALLLISEIEATRGKKGQAIRTLGDAALLFRSSEDPQQQARSLNKVASQYQALGALTKARNVLLRVVTILESEASSADELMISLDNLAFIEGELGNPRSAERYYRQRLELPTCMDPLERTRTLLNVVRMQLRQSNNQLDLLNSINDFDAALSMLPDALPRAQLAIELGAAIARTGSSEAILRSTATAYLESGLLLAMVAGDLKYQSLAIGYQAKLLAGDSGNAQALELTRKALRIAQVANLPHIEYLWQWQIARLFKAAGKSGKALQNYRYTIASIARIQVQLIALNRYDFGDLVLPVFHEMIDLLLQLAERNADDDERQKLLREARKTMELSNTSEVLDYFDGDCVLPTHQLALESLGNHNVIIYPLVLTDRISILVKFPDGIFQYVVPIARSSLNHEIIDFRQMLETADEDYIDSAKKLYDWLVAPYAAKLRDYDIDNLIFVPTGMLRTIPFSALHDGEQHLIEHYAVTTSLGLTLTDPKRLKDSGYKPLLGGISEKVGDFNALPGVVDEIEQISEVLPGQILLNSQMSLKALSTQLGMGNYTIVHLATHAVFDQEPSQSYLLAYDGEFTMEHLQQSVGLRRFVGDPLELLVLSACETALGNERAALGLAGVSLKSGARSTLASLWKISDRATSRIMVSFYKHLKAGASKSEALRLSQLEMIQDPLFSNPNLWSPFLLIGNWL